MLKLKIPSAIWSKYVCLVVHPGVKVTVEHRHWIGPS
jgi:hypothetical protein